MKKKVKEILGYRVGLPTGIKEKRFTGELSQLSVKLEPTSPSSAVSPIIGKIIDEMIYGNLKIVEMASGKYACEYETEYDGEKSTDLVYFNPKERNAEGSILLTAGTIKEDGSIVEYDVSSRIGTSVLAALFPMLMGNSEFSDLCKEYLLSRRQFIKDERLTDAKTTTTAFMDEVDNKTLAFLSDNAYRQLVTNALNVGLEIEAAQLFNEDGIFNETIKKVYCNSDPDIEFRYLKKVIDQPIVINNNGHSYSEEEKRLIPSVPTYIPPQKVINMLRIFASGRIRTGMLEGDNGTGKSTGVMYIAEQLKRPLVVQSIKIGDEGSNLLGGYFPFTDKDVKGLPSDAEMAYGDPEKCWEIMTGEKPERNISRVEVQEMYRKQLVAQSTGFIFKESPIVRAAKYGYVCEIQEANLANILASINSLTDINQGTAELENGEIINVHSNFVLVITLNANYTGTEEMHESVKNRFGIKYHLDAFTEDEMIERIMKRGTTLNVATVAKMARILRALEDYKKVNFYDDRSLGMRPLENWVATAEILNGDIFEAAEATVLTECTLEEDKLEELRSNVLRPAI